MDTQGKVAFITGGASGIGLGIAETFAAAGALIALTDVEETKLAPALEAVRAAGGDGIALPADVSDYGSLKAAADEAERELGPIDFLFNNAGIDLMGQTMDEYDFGDLQWIIGVNLWGMLNGLKAVVPGMRRRGSGYVVNTASIAGLQVNPNRLRMGPYAMTKHAVVAVSDSLRQDLTEEGITVSVFCPGAVATSIWQSGRNRPAEYGGPVSRAEDHPFWQQIAEFGLTPRQAGEILLATMRDGPLFIFTHPENRSMVQRRQDDIADGFRRAEQVLAELGLEPK